MVDISSPDPDFDILALLDAEIAKVTTKSDLEARRKLASQVINNSRSTHDQRSEAKRRVAEIGAQIEALTWEIIGNVAHFVDQHCDNCGSDHRVFIQHFEKLRTRYGAKVTRLSRISRPHPDAPRTCLIQRTITHFCADCCGEFGYGDEEAEIWITQEAYGLSSTYHQEEIEHVSASE